MQKLAVNQLEIGMQIVKLDRKWLDTPFLKHTFTIKSEKHLEQLRNICEYAFIKPTQPLINNSNKTAPIADRENKGKVVLSKSFKLLNVVLDDLKESSYLCSPKVKEIVNFLTVQVLTDSNTFEYLNTLQNDSPCIAHKSLRVLVLYLTLCKYLGIKKDKLLSLGCAALLHDIGMIKLPITFNSTERLTDTEKKHIISHTQLGVLLIEENKEFPSIVGRIVSSHHEHFNGSGYPAGLAGRDINLYSRMLTLVCTYEAITRNRVYKRALDSYSAASELVRVSGSMLDPRLVAKFIEIIREFPVGTKVKTRDGEIVKILAKTAEGKYQVSLLSSDNYKFLLNSDVFEGVIYE